MQSRRPRAASVKAGIPTLGALLAAGAQLVGCVEPMCAGNRVAELDTHGRLAAQRAGQGHPGTALHELAVATGLVDHATAPVAVAPVTPPLLVPVTPPTELQPVAPQGGMPPATVIPPPPPPTRAPTESGQRRGGVRRHTPTPPPQDPMHQPSWEGDSVYVGPRPVDDSPLAPMHAEPHPLGLRPV